MTGLQGCNEGGRDYKRRVNWGATGWREGNNGFGLCNGRLRCLWGSPVRTLEREAAAALPSFLPELKLRLQRRGPKFWWDPQTPSPSPRSAIPHQTRMHARTRPRTRTCFLRFEITHAKAAAGSKNFLSGMGIK